MNQIGVEIYEYLYWVNDRGSFSEAYVKGGEGINLKNANQLSLDIPRTRKFGIDYNEYCIPGLK